VGKEGGARGSWLLTHAPISCEYGYKIEGMSSGEAFRNIVRVD